MSDRMQRGRVYMFSVTMTGTRSRYDMNKGMVREPFSEVWQVQVEGTEADSAMRSARQKYSNGVVEHVRLEDGTPQFRDWECEMEDPIQGRGSVNHYGHRRDR
jgi:hypothetical protein